MGTRLWKKLQTDKGGTLPPGPLRRGLHPPGGAGRAEAEVQLPSRPAGNSDAIFHSNSNRWPRPFIEPGHDSEDLSSPLPHLPWEARHHCEAKFSTHYSLPWRDPLFRTDSQLGHPSRVAGTPTQHVPLPQGPPHHLFLATPPFTAGSRWSGL